MRKGKTYYPVTGSPVEYDLSTYSRYTHKEREEKGEVIYLGMGVKVSTQEFKHFWKLVTND